MLLEKIKSPADIKNMTAEQLRLLAAEIRGGILKRDSTIGGHVGPNLGFVEATIALHYVFNMPEDRIVFDVSHQVYPHKMLTGRAYGFIDSRRMAEVSGYSSPAESPEYDCFEIGHTSTSVALATGLQKARDILGGKENVVAVIGDGSLSGGEAFEGLDVAAELGTNIIIVVNDNEMSIAENHGGIYRNLQLLRQTGGKAELNLFKAMGFEYKYVEQGNDIAALIEVFKEVRDTPRPVVVHLHTEKGHGWQPAVDNKEKWHWNSPFDIETGAPKAEGGGESAAQILGGWLREEMKRDPKLVSISAAVPASIGFGPEERRQAGAQYVDVGIAEEAAVAMASGMARRGAHPVFSTYATFLQRTYDQMEKWAIGQDKYSVALRVPEGEVSHSTEEYDTDYSELNRYKVVRRGKGVALIGLGNFLAKAERVADMLKESGLDATVINPRYISGVDEELLESLKADHSLVVTLEDGCVDGGFGERISRFYGSSDMKTMNFGVAKALYDRYDVRQLLLDNRLTDGQVVEDILGVMGR